MTINSTGAKFTLFNKISILLFSIVCTYFCGACMLAYNLRQTGKKNKVWYMVIGSVIGYVILNSIVKSYTKDSLINLLIPNIIMGYLLAYPVWDYLLPEIDEFQTKKVSVPIIVTVVVWGGLYLLNLYFVKHN